MTSSSIASDATPRSPRGPLRSAVVFNPVRVEDMPERRELIESILTDAGWPLPSWLETTEQDPGAGQARHAIENGAQLVFVCGGDGTVRSCIEGLADTGIALAILPVQRTHVQGVSESVESAVSRLLDHWRGWRSGRSPGTGSGAGSFMW